MALTFGVVSASWLSPPLARPVRGREYFGISTLALILDVASSWVPLQKAAPRPGDDPQPMLNPEETTATPLQAASEQALARP